MRFKRHELEAWFRSHYNPRKWLPILNWLPNYKKEYIQGDIVAGITVGMLMVPQSLAIAALVGVDPQYGLYSSFVGSLVNAVFGTSKDSSLGPSVMVAVMTARFNEKKSPSLCSALGFITGLVLILASILDLGFLMNFVSYPILTCFICTAAFTIASTQLPVLFGISVQNAAEKSIYEVIYEFFTLITRTNVSDLLMGSITCSIAVTFALLFKHIVMPKMEHQQDLVIKLLWFFCVARNAWLTILCALSGYLLNVYAPNITINLTGTVNSGFISPQFPLTNIQTNGNNTTFSEVFPNIYQSFYLIPVLGAIEHLSVVRSFSKQNSYECDLTQELFNLGIVNLVNSFFGGFPIGGSLSRAAVNSLSNVKTPLSGIVGSLIVILVIQFLTTLFYFIPKAALAGTIIAAVLPIMNLSFVKNIYMVNKFEAVPCVLSILIGFYRMEMGMLVGVMFTAGFIMFRELRPRLHHFHQEDFVTSFRIRGGIHFPGAEFFSRRIRLIKTLHPNTNEIDIDCCGFYEMDYTVAMELKDAIMMLKSKGVTVKLVRVKRNGGVSSILRAIGLGEFICEMTLDSDSHFFRRVNRLSLGMSNTSNINHSHTSCHASSIKSNNLLQGSLPLTLDTIVNMAKDYPHPSECESDSSSDSESSSSLEKRISESEITTGRFLSSNAITMRPESNRIRFDPTVENNEMEKYKSL